MPRSGIACLSRYPIDCVVPQSLPRGLARTARPRSRYRSPQPLNANARSPVVGDLAPANQYFGAAGADALQDALPPPAALHEDLPLLAGAAPPLALQEALPPAADGSAAPGVAPFPPPHPIAEPMSIPVTAETARVFARFIVSSSPRSS